MYNHVVSTPGRKGSQVTEGGALVIGGPEAGVGVGDSRLSPHTPAYNTMVIIIPMCSNLIICMRST